MAQTSALKSAYDKSLLDEIGLNALRIAFIGVKRKHIRNIVGYYNGILTNLFDNLYRMEIERGA
ncbi:hypothetical protein [Bacillus pumilus]|uniref:hypothetical protein n=1 Tax=Bacillus pumilus TaxID=1408 RepID=UPI0024937C11|nr:hypothetical protein [Bacillus pumilus]